MTAHARLSECGNAALALAREGWPVFPCDHRLARCKAPLTEHGFKDATTDPVQIEAWWRQFPNALDRLSDRRGDRRVGSGPGP